MFEQFKKLICQYVEADEEEILPSSRFSEELGFNSYDYMCMLGEAEDEFDIEIIESEATSIKTVGEMVEYFEVLKNEKNQNT
ncbi:MAG: acyl carrier protein [Ruminococcus sp.]|nr:acyl carrier protein [Ruminococcus sp.]